MFKSISQYYFIFVLLVIFSCSHTVKPQMLVVNVKNEGAIGDGKHNDYPAFKKAVDKINQNKSGKLIIPNGIYFLDAYNKAGAPKMDLVFRDIDGLEIIGDKNTVISVKGDIHRNVTRKSKKHKFSSTQSISPLIVRDSKNVYIENLEIDGNVDQMTRDTGVVEGNSYGLYLVNNQNVTIRNIYSHHHMADGLKIIKTKGGVNSNYLVENVVAKYNGRQGLTIGGLDNALFKNCEFSETGKTQGSYGHHAPSAGLDIEPIHGYKVSHITFEQCKFMRNIGSEIVISHPNTTTDINFKNCYFEDDVDSKRKWAIIVNANGVNFDHCTFNFNYGSIYPTWHKPGTKASFTNSIIKSKSSGIVAVPKHNNSEVLVDNCTFEYTGNQELSSYFPYIRMRGMIFTNNTIRIPAPFLKTKGVNALIENTTKAGNNIFKTGKQNIKARVSYKGSNLNK